MKRLPFTHLLVIAAMAVPATLAVVVPSATAFAAKAPKPVKASCSGLSGSASSQTLHRLHGHGSHRWRRYIGRFWLQHSTVAFNSGSGNTSLKTFTTKEGTGKKDKCPVVTGSSSVGEIKEKGTVTSATGLGSGFSQRQDQGHRLPVRERQQPADGFALPRYARRLLIHVAGVLRDAPSGEARGAFFSPHMSSAAVASEGGGPYGNDRVRTAFIDKTEAGAMSRSSGPPQASAWTRTALACRARQNEFPTPRSAQISVGPSHRRVLRPLGLVGRTLPPRMESAASLAAASQTT